MQLVSSRKSVLNFYGMQLVSVRTSVFYMPVIKEAILVLCLWIFEPSCHVGDLSFMSLYGSCRHTSMQLVSER